jgi:hypothetical protein
VSPEALEILEHEAIAYVKECLQREPEVTPSERKDQEVMPKRGERTDIERPLVPATAPARRVATIPEMRPAHNTSDDEWSDPRYAPARVRMDREVMPKRSQRRAIERPVVAATAAARRVATIPEERPTHKATNGRAVYGLDRWVGA